MGKISRMIVDKYYELGGKRGKPAPDPKKAFTVSKAVSHGRGRKSDPETGQQACVSAGILSRQSQFWQAVYGFSWERDRRLFRS